MDWSFCLFVLQLQGFLTHYRTLPELVPKIPGKTKNPRELLL